MSGKPLDKKVANRRLFVRLGLVVAYGLALALCFVAGKGHTILVDNKGTEDGRFAALDGVMVSIDGKEALEMYSGDRDRVIVKSQSHRIVLEDPMGTKLLDKRFSLPIDEDMMILSIPKILAGVEPFIEKFVPKDIPLTADESIGNTNAFTSPEAGAPEVPIIP